MSKKNYEDLSIKLLSFVGEKDNISRFTHCVTRLRFDLKDKSLARIKDIEDIDGVIGTQWSGEQLQVIIGSDVDEAYDAVIKASGLSAQEKISENLDEKKGKMNLKSIGHSILAYTSPTMNGVIIMMMAACMIKTIQVVLSPSMLNVIAVEDDIYLVLQFLYDAFFYYLPIFLGYSAAKALNINPLYGIYIGAMIIVPSFSSLVGTRETISIFGLPAPVASYAQTFLPVLLGVWVMSWVYKFWKKFIPDILSTIFVPTLTVLVMLPLMFVVCAPLGTYLGEFIGNFFITMSESHIIVRVVAAVVLAVLFPYLVLTGMHGALTTFAITALLTTGHESYLLPIMTGYNFAVFGVALGAAIKIKDKQNKANFIAFFISGIFGSITEPILYGIVLKYKKAMKTLMIACGVVGLYVGILSPIYYTLSGATVLTMSVPWTAEGVASSNIVSGTIMLVLALVAGVIAGLFIDYNKTVDE